MKIKSIYLLLTIILCVCLPMFGHAQVGPPPDPIDTPFDGGLSILIGAGVLYGIKKIKREKKNQDQNL